MQEIKLEKIFFNKTDKEGKPLKNKHGTSYQTVVLCWDGKKATKYCEKGKSEKDIDIMEDWREGDVVTVKLQQNGDYLNFNLPTKTDLLDVRITALEEKINKIEKLLQS